MVDLNVGYDFLFIRLSLIVQKHVNWSELWYDTNFLL